MDKQENNRNMISGRELPENNEKQQDLVLTGLTRKYLETTRLWATFLSIIGFIGIGFILFFGLIFSFIISLSRYSENSQIDTFDRMPFNPMWIAMMYVVMGVIYFFPIYYLNRFASKLKKALLYNDSLFLESSMKFLKSHYKFIGILIIVLLILYPVIIFAAFFSGMMNHM